jgi:hypothetical protein
MTTDLTPLERAVIRLTAAENWPDFRDPGVRVTRRENTGVGRFTYLEDAYGHVLRDGFYSANGRLIEIPGLKIGLGFEVAVTNGRLEYIEFVLYGDETWDGSEEGWRISQKA